MKRFLAVIIVCLFAAFFAGCGSGTDVNDTSIDDGQTIEDLNDIDNFRDNALEHILEGEINSKGQATGFHYEGFRSKKGEIIPGTKTEPDENGIYEAKVRIKDVEKQSNKGYSTFFPEEWTAQDVVDAINEAYETNTLISGNTYEGLTEEGIVIRMYLDGQDKIISAFPIY